MKTRNLLSAGVAGACLLLSHGLTSGQAPPSFPKLPEPAVLQLPAPKTSGTASYNQRMADAVAAHLRNSNRLRHYSIDVKFQNGVALLRGKVAGEEQRQTALALARNVPGVDVVQEHLDYDGRGGLLPAQAFDPLQLPEAGPPPQPFQAGPPAANSYFYQMPPTPLPQPQATAPAYQEPEPIFKAATGPDQTMQPPLMPPYAWPTYAPYNNYSRVAYPTLYPYEAWPFIGPFYPFPKVPLGWRSITLSWEDGYWWYAKNATGHDWWRIRYW